jgi:hypothetical protein
MLKIIFYFLLFLCWSCAHQPAHNSCLLDPGSYDHRVVLKKKILENFDIPKDKIFIADSTYRKIDKNFILNIQKRINNKYPRYTKNSYDCDTASDIFKFEAIKYNLETLKYGDTSVPIGVFWFKYIPKHEQAQSLIYSDVFYKTKTHSMVFFIENEDIKVLEPQSGEILSIDGFYKKYYILEFVFVKI